MKNRNGIIAVDKPEGVTSRRVVDRVLALVAPAKAGHAGTLDPLATGVLVICFGAATRLIPFIQEGRKRYRAEFLLGRRSDTDDVTGAVVETAGATPVSRMEIEAQLPRFVGMIAQVPPQFSAVHVAGKRAHQRARRGETMELAPRPVEVHRIDVVAFDWPRLTLDIECGSGTYVRSLGRDLGEALGCGAVMSGLVREAVGAFRREDCVSFDALDHEALRSLALPMLAALPGMPRVECSIEAIADMRMGRRVACEVSRAAAGPLRDGEAVACVERDGDLIALAVRCDDGRRLQPTLVIPAEK